MNRKAKHAQRGAVGVLILADNFTFAFLIHNYAAALITAPPVTMSAFQTFS